MLWCFGRCSFVCFQMFSANIVSMSKANKVGNVLYFIAKFCMEHSEPPNMGKLFPRYLDALICFWLMVMPFCILSSSGGRVIKHNKHDLFDDNQWWQSGSLISWLLLSWDSCCGHYGSGCFAAFVALTATTKKSEQRQAFLSNATLCPFFSFLHLRNGWEMSCVVRQHSCQTWAHWRRHVLSSKQKTCFGYRKNTFPKLAAMHQRRVWVDGEWHSCAYTLKSTLTRGWDPCGGGSCDGLPCPEQKAAASWESSPSTSPWSAPELTDSAKVLSLSYQKRKWERKRNKNPRKTFFYLSSWDWSHVIF